MHLDIWKHDNAATGPIFVYGMLLREGDRPASLSGYRLAFSGHATIELAEGEHVLGAVIEGAKLSHYDGIEGTDTRDPSSLEGYYRRFPVRLDDGSYAWVYKMNPKFEGAPGPKPPGSYYLDMIERGYLRWGYPNTGLRAAVERVQRHAA